jgi:ubiquinone/menaquinone biosynthesis C-methylase UbiE
MGAWAEQAVPRLSHLALGTRRFHDLRARVCAGLRGDIIEIGFGSGLNSGHYPAGVSSVAAVEPSEVAWGLAREEVRRAGARVSRAGTDGQRLEHPDASFDGALCTFSLCTIPDPAVALAEVARVLRPGGELHFLEHGLASDVTMQRWQHRLTPLQRVAWAGCHLDRPIRRLVEDSDLTVTRLDTFYLTGPSPWTYFYLGRARRP